MSASAFAKLRTGEAECTLEDLPNVEVEHTFFWDVVKTRFDLTDDEIQSLVDAKKASASNFARKTPVTVTLKYINRKLVEVSNLLPGEVTVSFLKSEATKIWKDLEATEFELRAGKNHAITDDYLRKCAFPLNLTVKVDQLGFSDFMSLEKALEYAGAEELKTGDANSLSFPHRPSVSSCV